MPPPFRRARRLSEPAYDATDDFRLSLLRQRAKRTADCADEGITTVQDLVAKAKTGAMSFASAGVGSAHWAAERFIVTPAWT